MLTSLAKMPIVFPSPSVDDHRRFLISFLFSGCLIPGPKECVERAYRDFSRTAKGITKDDEGKERKRSAHALVETFLREAISTEWVRDGFDEWHQRCCGKICEHYARNGFANFRIGQAQKWLNMSVKYILSLSEAGLYSALPSSSLRDVAHVPLDDFILTVTDAYLRVPLRCPWSQISEYNIYMNVQQWIHGIYPDSAPIDIEFHLYNKEAARRREARS